MIKISKELTLEKFTEESIWGDRPEDYRDIPGQGKFIADVGGTGGGAPSPMSVIVSGDGRKVLVTILGTNEWDEESDDCEEVKSTARFETLDDAVNFLKLSLNWAR